MVSTSCTKLEFLDSLNIFSSRLKHTLESWYCVHYCHKIAATEYQDPITICCHTVHSFDEITAKSFNTPKEHCITYNKESLARTIPRSILEHVVCAYNCSIYLGWMVTRNSLNTALNQTYLVLVFSNFNFFFGANKTP